MRTIKSTRVKNAMKHVFPFAVTATLLFSSNCVSNAKQEENLWALDQSHCKAIFIATHNTLSPVTGWFDSVGGKIDYDGKDLTKAKVVAYITTESLDSGSSLRDMHLRSEHFFDVKKFPVIEFHSTKITPSGPGKFKMQGDLKIKGVSKAVNLDCEGPRGPIIEDSHKRTFIGVTAKTKINKNDFGMTWNRDVSKGIKMVSDEAQIILEIEAVKVSER